MRPAGNVEPRPRTRVDPRTRILVSAGGSTRVGGPMGVPTFRCSVGIHALSEDRVDVPERKPEWRSDCGQGALRFPCPACRRIDTPICLDVEGVELNRNTLSYEFES